MFLCIPVSRYKQYSQIDMILTNSVNNTGSYAIFSCMFKEAIYKWGHINHTYCWKDVCVFGKLWLYVYTTPFIFSPGLQPSFELSLAIQTKWIIACITFFLDQSEKLLKWIFYLFLLFFMFYFHFVTETIWNGLSMFNLSSRKGKK